ncbi:hypothetical protein MNBD_GAMMA08-548 [hydrothermal vent metagenome]|uniref:Uncharacterized protein n=1 Tax=hydrothermal vent metagenome TaxID=652676 RepID=A0A3B0X6L7_9ZZZZ
MIEFLGWLYADDYMLGYKKFILIQTKRTYLYSKLI